MRSLPALSVRNHDFNLKLGEVNRVKEKQFTLHCKVGDLHAVTLGTSQHDPVLCSVLLRPPSPFPLVLSLECDGEMPRTSQ